MLRKTYRTRYMLPVIGSLIAGITMPVLADDEEAKVIPFDEASIYFELNNTDGDLGIHALIDGEPWAELEIEGPGDKNLLRIKAKSRLQQQGLTELFFESAEPTFDELAPADFFKRFPEGTYDIEGESLDGAALESEVQVTHLMPAPPLIRISGVIPGGCDDEELPVISSIPFTISWDPVTTSHPDLGRTGEPVVVEKYQVVLEREEPTPLLFSVDVDADVNMIEVPATLVNAGEELKVEVLVREESGNQTATEGCFET